ncbi:hypothetical protein Poli38472_013551 [Pythium oligandrum]|uniref:Sestrin n=1 Tax=Pythium oligandrum TaxID=41045 RepID=A0A8K1C8T8_PYTOL|nr:hypothetical protein Poli38472_013551 [Pythium oligandrum]|eukprot:TMW58077.1 hypothetical protein Poli38472_013551 [Pythium oligandrum]
MSLVAAETLVAVTKPRRSSSLSPSDPLAAAEARRIGVAKDAFFRRLLVSDPAVQKQMMTLVTQELVTMIEDRSTLVEDYYPTVLRLEREAPVKVMREAFAQVRSTVEAVWPELHEATKVCHQVSYFVDNKDVECVEESSDEELDALFYNAFLRTGRVSHFIQLLGWHKSYLQLFQNSFMSIMIRDGALPMPWRNYIALMAASELRCHYWADLQQYYFVVNGGDYEWVKGIDYISPKLFRLHELSSLLAHRPWLITEQHISDLLSSDQDDSWSVSELVHAIIVMCMYHSMSSIALGLGCAEEEDLAIFGDYGAAIAEQQAILDLQYPYGMSSKEDQPQIEVASSAGSLTDQDMAMIERDESQLLSRLKSGHEGSDTADDDDDDDENSYEDESLTVDGVFEVAEEQSYGLHADGHRRRDTLWRFCGGSVIRYADFDVRSTDYNVLHTEDFSWEEHGFSLVKRYFPGKAGQILEDLFNLTDKLTYDYYGSQKEQDVDTSPYRSAIWYYVHRIFGICHDDYDYRQVNEFLNRPTKIFIKKVACTPWKVTKADFEHFDRTLSPSEKCHVTLLVAEARKQAGLMYGLRAVMQHMR